MYVFRCWILTFKFVCFFKKHIYELRVKFVYIKRARETIVVNNYETFALYNRIMSEVRNSSRKREYFVV